MVALKVFQDGFHFCTGQYNGKTFRTLCPHDLPDLGEGPFKDMLIEKE